MIIIVYILILFFFLALLGFAVAINFETKQKNAVFGGLEMSVFLVMMPKNDLKKDDLMQKQESLLL